MSFPLIQVMLWRRVPRGVPNEGDNGTYPCRD